MAEVEHVEAVWSEGTGYMARCSCGELAEGPFDTPAEARAHADAHVGRFASFDEAHRAHQAVDAQVAAEAKQRAEEAEQAAQVEADRIAQLEARLAEVERAVLPVEDPEDPAEAT